MDPIQIFNHLHTYGNHPVPCVVGVRNLQIIREEDLVRKSAAMGLAVPSRDVAYSPPEANSAAKCVKGRISMPSFVFIAGPSG